MKEQSRVLALIESGFGSKRILVIGDVMLDRSTWGEVDRISPEAPVPVLRSVRTTSAPGGAANVAMNLVGLGVKVTQAGFWGNDAEMRELSATLGSAGVDASGMIASGHSTISKTRIVSRNQQLLRLDVESAAPHPEEEHEALLQRSLELTRTADAVVLSDYDKGALSGRLCQAVIALARERRIAVLVDPKGRDFTKYTGATTICPNLQELGLVTGINSRDVTELLAAAQRLVRDLGIDYMTVTMSEKGIRVQYADAFFHSPTRAREVFDVTGAGDTVIATLAASLAGGLDPETAVTLANVAAGIVVGKRGTAPISRNELVAEFTTSSQMKGRDKILDLEHLLVRLAEWRATGNRIVFTNGCFDILHVGHITLLEQCRDFGDKVVVGVNSDISVRGLKGPSRPVVGEKERARVLAALGATDAVIIFDQPTPLELVRSLRPDVLVKGGDYTNETIVGAEDVTTWGGRVEIVPTVNGVSTTNTIRKMTTNH
ncbi:MAG TPA: D-glycero-beta-D-manno-heptose-7-phosphate kinase [Acidobacteriaceae bacterium]|nr:D-glycero-beta-D-manno-heptose-7-phosphate kinase [Acidobacteriaceae bacterium]